MRLWLRRLDLNRRTPLPARLVQMLQSPDEVHVAIKIGNEKFECIGQRRSAWCTKAELSDPADSETSRRLPHADYVLHRTGCSQEDDQLLREGWQWHDSRRRYGSRHTL